MNRVYADHAATTRPAPEVVEAMLPFLREQFANPSASYAAARRVRKAVQVAREQVAALLGAQADEIVFTSCGTESINTALASVRLRYDVPDAAISSDPLLTRK